MQEAIRKKFEDFYAAWQDANDTDPVSAAHDLARTLLDEEEKKEAVTDEAMRTRQEEIKKQIDENLQKEKDETARQAEAAALAAAAAPPVPAAVAAGDNKEKTPYKKWVPPPFRPGEVLTRGVHNPKYLKDRNPRGVPVCYNCGSPDHISKDCEIKERVCTLCQAPGHKYFECRRNARATNTCLNCRATGQEYGHKWSVCPGRYEKDAKGVPVLQPLRFPGRKGG